MASDRQKQRFEREVTLAANLRHPNIVTVYDSGLTEGRYYYVMEYVHGQPLNEYVAAKGLRVDEKLKLFATICSAVSYAHLQNVIHRDLKPGNIMVDARGAPHVLDFGLAKSGTFDPAGSGSPITVTSQFMGTLAYASPEQTMGDPSMVDGRSDVYSLGVILFARHVAK
jgi:serine/threonine protein kinase